ncbi:MAG: hypothetical protein IKY71_01130 [Bacteroidaceae bacterium]|nr:hypothetical protein [Bacteroidaceae bacterium]
MRHTACTIILLTAATLALFTGCDNGYDCSIENTAYNRINFYSTNEYGIEETLEFPQTISVTMMVNGNETIVVNHVSNASGLQLPMSYTNDCDTTIIRYDNNITDTIYIAHENIPYYISMECGTVMYHKILSLQHTHNFIDSAAIVNDYVNFDYNENIKLYLVK